MTLAKLSQAVTDYFGDKLQKSTIANNELTIEVKADALISVCEALRDETPFQFEQLIDVCGVDYSEYGCSEWSTQTSSASGFSRGVQPAVHARLRFGDEPSYKNTTMLRFASVYHLLSISHNHRIRVRVFIENESFPVVPSVINIWPVANWFEREAFDLYGILYDGHPDLRRILTDYGFVGHPFRKDFPLIGHVEMKYDPEQKRVIYQPVSIEPRVLVPRVIRDDGFCMNTENSMPDNTPQNSVVSEKTDA